MVNHSLTFTELVGVLAHVDVVVLLERINLLLG